MTWIRQNNGGSRLCLRRQAAPLVFTKKLRLVRRLEMAQNYGVGPNSVVFIR